MYPTNRSTGPTSPSIQSASQSAAAAALPADQAKRSFVPPVLIKQGKVVTITQDYGGSGFDPNLP
ncbi:MAG: hypothetical protein U0350_33615 [Caldilineaceae bacterium]